MQLYFAPLEGITNCHFRCLFDKHFGGIDKYFAPFISTSEIGLKNEKEIKDILPKNNIFSNKDLGTTLVPQLLGNKPKQMADYIIRFADYGYQEVNINIGCPSKTVIGKGKGSGMLRDPEELDAFLDQLYANIPAQLQKIVSVKTRLGMSEAQEFQEILGIYMKYPIKELTIHPRTQREFYSGNVHMDAWERAFYCLLSRKSTISNLCYNGDIKTVADAMNIANAYAQTNSIMIGRGLMSDPFLAEKIHKSSNASSDSSVVKSEKSVFNKTELSRLRAFHDDLLDMYTETLYGDKQVLFKMKEMWVYLIESFPDQQKLFKKIKKSQHIQEYKGYAYQLLSY